MPTSATFVIVGAGLAGAKAAETLRVEGFEDRIIVFGQEGVPPYERPALSKSYLRGETGFDEARVHDAGFYEASDIELQMSTTVTAVDPGASEVVLQTGERVGYDRLLLATGAEPRRLSVPGAELPGVHYLRTVTDADAIRETITPGAPLVVIGAGWIGAEVAASARQLGMEVAMVAPDSVPLARVLGEEVGSVFRDLHADHGVDLHMGVALESVHGAARVEEVRLSDGAVLPAATVVVGVGVVPRTDLAKTATLNEGNGLVTNEHLATSVPQIYAAGDVASVFYPAYRTHIRLEHWSAALYQGPVAAKNMLGQSTVYDRIPFFFSYQYDFNMEYRGWAPDFDQVVFRGDHGSQEFLAFWLRDDKVLAAMNVNTWGLGEAIEALVRAQQRVNLSELADPNADLAALVRRPGEQRTPVP